MSDMPSLYDLLDADRSKPTGTDIDSDKLSTQHVMKTLEALRYRSDTTDRKWLAIWTAIIVSIWLIVVLLILLLNETHIRLNTTTLVTLLGTTTLNVLGLSFIVLRGHFRSAGKQLFD